MPKTGPGVAWMVSGLNLELNIELACYVFVFCIPRLHDLTATVIVDLCLLSESHFDPECLGRRRQLLMRNIDFDLMH